MLLNWVKSRNVIKTFPESGFVPKSRIVAPPSGSTGNPSTTVGSPSIATISLEQSDVKAELSGSAPTAKRCAHTLIWHKLECNSRSRKPVSSKSNVIGDVASGSKLEYTRTLPESGSEELSMLTANQFYENKIYSEVVKNDCFAKDATEWFHVIMLSVYHTHSFEGDRKLMENNYTRTECERNHKQSFKCTAILWLKFRWSELKWLYWFLKCLKITSQKVKSSMLPSPSANTCSLWTILAFVTSLKSMTWM